MKVQDVMQRNVIVVREDDDAEHALQVMLWNGIRHLPVLREGRLIGVLTEREILTGRVDARVSRRGRRRNVGELMASPPHMTQPHADLDDAAAIMAVHGVDSLPVLDRDRIVGLLTITDVLTATTQSGPPAPRPDERRVSEVMTPRVVACRPDDRLLDATASMVQYGARHLPVINPLGEVVGILSDRDVRLTVGNPLSALDEGQRSRRLESLTVAEAMTAEPRTIDEEAPLGEAVAILVDQRFGALPVVDEDEKLVGILSYVDVLRHFNGRPALHSRPRDEHQPVAAR